MFHWNSQRSISYRKNKFFNIRKILNPAPDSKMKRPLQVQIVHRQRARQKLPKRPRRHRRLRNRVFHDHREIARIRRFSILTIQIDPGKCRQLKINDLLDTGVLG